MLGKNNKKKTENFKFPIKKKNGNSKTTCQKCQMAKIFFGAKWQNISSAPSAPNVKKFLRRLRRQMSTNFFGAFGAKCQNFSSAPSAPNVKNFLRRLRRQNFNVKKFLRRLRRQMFNLFSSKKKLRVGIPSKW